MSTKYFVTDTHPLIWYLEKESKRLSRKVLNAFQSAEEGGDVHIWVPAPVAWEISLLFRKKKRIILKESFEDLVLENFYFKNLTITELFLDDIVLANSYNFHDDPFDNLIVATAVRLGRPLLTADEKIKSSGLCSVFWN